MARVNEGSHSFTCHPHVYLQMKYAIPAFTPQPQSITALWLVPISHPSEGRKLSLPGWLGKILRWFNHPKMVTHPSASHGSREWNSQASSHESNTLTTRPPSHHVTSSSVVRSVSLHLTGQLVSRLSNNNGSFL